MSMLEKHNRLTSDTFVALDFDRTLVDTDALFETFVALAEDYINLPKQEIDDMYAAVTATGGSFDVASYVQQHFAQKGAPGGWEALRDAFIAEVQQHDMSLDGAHELIAYCRQQSSVDVGIVTYGNPVWQAMKLAACRFDTTPTMITNSKDKGAMIAGWERDGVFYLPDELGGAAVRRVVLVDDKASSFRGLPSEPTRGYWLVGDDGGLLPSQQGEVPANVTRIMHLHEIRPALL